ncbi:2'-5' RNA ligase [Gordonibacter sp. An230]|uniref:RNA 2',3'-cyclic phosphodiesterase n=1 Tax=Gordonibacter sp. An230 TaxID=1965592 RepID=UPI000B3A926F|nr:RNA 2',3'-cyclic phosphodiesterase [Gordonibacter sp. An230]OUO89604.1 2'-5' RNA ligase [Gordonibacter sp. An230]
MRTFIALELPTRFADDTSALAHRLEAVVKGRFLPREARHLTLAFLGEVPEADVPAAAEALEAACKGSPRIPLRTAGLGTFGHESDTTLWLGIDRSSELERLAARVRQELAARGLSFDGKPFKPHVTLARRACVPRRSLPPLPFPLADQAETATLFKSALRSDGAVYEPLSSVRLGG